MLTQPKKPIVDTPAYRKFLNAIFPEYPPTFPYFANHANAQIIVAQLSTLFV